MVSVVVPIYKTEKYLRQCIESIVSQTYSDLQIIFVDGDSPDNSKKICEEYAAKDPRITILCHENEGLSSDRNVGMDIAKGEYITFIDGDDFIAPDMIENMLKAAQSENADMVACQVIRCEEQDTTDTVKFPKSEYICKSYTDDDKMRTFLQGEKIGTTAWAKLYKTYMFKEIKYPVGKNHEDVFTTYKLVHIANRLCIINSVGYVYRNNMSGLSKGFSKTRLDSIRGSLERTQFIEKYYPNLVNEAYIGITHSCTRCLMLMGKAGYQDVETFKWMHELYKKYGKYYIRSSVTSKLGKIAVAIAKVNVKTAWLMFRVVHKNVI